MVLKYLNERQRLFLRKVHPGAMDVAMVGYTFLIKCLYERHAEINPEFTRAVDLLEHLLLSFLEHSMSTEMLRDMGRLVDITDEQSL